MIKQCTVFAVVVLALIVDTTAYARHPKPQPTVAPITTLSMHDKRHLLRDNFSVVRTVQQIPEPVQKQLFHGSKDGLNGMVNPGQEYQATDIIPPKPLPYRRLIFAAISQGYCLVYYEYSGQRIDLFRFSGGQTRRAWAGSLMWARYRPLTLTELRTQIKMGRYYSVRGGEWFPALPQ